MKKDLEWLKEEVKEHIKPYDREDYLSYTAGGTDVAELILGYIDQLDEPEKPEIPDYVAEYIRREKENNFFSFTGALGDIEYQYPKIQDWLYENQEEFFRAWFDGYTVEEKKYRVAVDHENGDWTYASDGRRSFKTTDKTKAETLAEILGGRVIAEEVTE